MAAEGLAYLLAGLTGAATGYMNERTAQKKRQQEEVEAAANRRLKALQGAKTEADLIASGFRRKPDSESDYEFDPANLMPGETVPAAIRRMGTKTEPTYKIADLFERDQDGRLRLKPDASVPASFVEKEMGRDIDDPNSVLSGIVEQHYGTGATKGLKTPQIAQILSGMENRAFQKAQSESSAKAAEKRLGQTISAQDKRAKLSQDEINKRHAENKALQVASATKDEVKNVENLNAAIARMDQIVAEAPAFNPSGAEYLKLKTKASAASYDPIAMLSGKPSALKLSPEEQQRLAWYQGLSTDAITSIFEAGGKQLTPTEKSELGNLAITPADTADQILAKVGRLRAKLERSRGASQKVLDRFGSARQSPREESAQKLGVSKKNLEAIDKFPVPKQQKTVSAGGLTPEEQRELAELEKKFGGK